MSKQQTENIDFRQIHLIEQMAEFLLTEAQDDKNYNKEYIDKIKKVAGDCWGLCATLAKGIIIDRHLESKKSSEIKPGEFIHDSAWFQKSRELFASWRRDKHYHYSKTDKKYMLEFIQIILFTQKVGEYLPGVSFTDIETSLPVIAQDDKSLGLQFKLIGGVARFFSSSDLEKVLENLLIKKQRFLFLSSKTHVGLIYFNQKGVLQFYDPNYKKSAIMENISIADIVKYFIEEFPNVQYGDRCYTEIFFYQSADDKDIDFPTPEKIEYMCIDKNTGDSCGSPDFPYSQSLLNIDRLPVFIPYFKYNMEKLVEKTSKKIAKMMFAAMIGDIEILNNMLSRSHSINLDEQDHEQKTMLMYSVFSNRLKFLKLLISKGVDLNAKDIHGNTALMCALDNADNKIFDELLACGADPLIANNLGKTVFDYAERLQKYETIKTLLDYRDAHGKTLLALACEAKDHKLVEKIIIIGSNPAVKKKFLLDTLDYFRDSKDIQSKEILKDSFSKTLMLQVCVIGEIEIVDKVIKLKVDINAKNAMGRTALSVAAVTGHANIVELLLKNNADFFLTDKNGKTALDYAVKNNHVSVIESMINYAIIQKNTSILKAILKDKIAVTMIKDKNILHTAILNGNVETVKNLLKSGINKTFLDEDDMSPLMLAAANGLADMVKTLLEFSVDVMQKNESGKTALDYAQEYGHGEVVKLLQQKQVELLYEYAKINNTSGMKKLLGSGVPVDSKNSQGRTALFYAAAQGQIDAVKFLLQAHADPHIVDNEKNQPFDYAFQKRNIGICWLLVGGKRDDRAVQSVSATPGGRG